VGGVMSFMGYFSGLLSQGTSRFLTVGLGRGDMRKLRDVFSACATIHIALALLTLLLGETVGLWFVNNKLVIDAERMFAANYVYQLSLFSCFLGITQTPYMATIIAHEKMSTFAFMSIFDVTAKLLVVCLLLYVDADKLIIFSSFYFVVGIITFLMYRIYCLRKFEECNMRWYWDSKLYKDIWNYVGWNSIGTFAFMANNQGFTILLNMFFSNIVNAARGIATTVSSHVNGFVTNFQQAVNPQTMKYYAVGDFDSMNRLICNNAKYSSYLLMLVGLPVFMETEFLIRIWLGHVPEYVVPFIRVTLVECFFRAIDFPIGSGIHAFGRMKLPNITSSIVYLSVLPIVYVALSLGTSPVLAYIIVCIVYPFALGFDLWILKKYSNFAVSTYLREVPFKSTLMILCASFIPYVLTEIMDAGWMRLCLTVPVCVLVSSILILFVGLDRRMRGKVFAKVQNVIMYKR
jgi:O-antigen/teichoic acid export membrane protein